MTSHRDKRIEPDTLSLTTEEKEASRTKLLAVIDSADPPSWAGLPLPEKLPWWKRVVAYLKELFWE